MTERERLIELVRQARSFYMEDDDYESVDEYIADYLLANGVIVPPCGVGDTVYDIHGNPIEIQGMAFNCVFRSAYDISDTSVVFPFLEKRHILLPFEFDVRDFGKTVFLTKEDAEKALKERQSHD